MGSTSFTPLSAGGLWLAVIMTPMTWQLSLLERRAASRPTLKTTESSRSLYPASGQPLAKQHRQSSISAHELLRSLCNVRFHPKLSSVSKSMHRSLSCSKVSAYPSSAILKGAVRRLRKASRSRDYGVFGSHNKQNDRLFYCRSCEEEKGIYKEKRYGR